MLGNINNAKRIYIACGHTDLRKSIDGLVAIVERTFHINPCDRNLFLFCGRRKDRIKALYWESDGFVLLYKRLEEGKYHWPAHTEEAKLITRQQLRWLMEGLSVEQKGVIRPIKDIQFT